MFFKTIIKRIAVFQHIRITFAQMYSEFSEPITDGRFNDGDLNNSYSLVYMLTHGLKLHMLSWYALLTECIFVS